MTLEEWESFPEKFLLSKDKNEVKLRELIVLDILPGVVEGLKVCSFFDAE